MNSSILTSIKQNLGLTEEQKEFDSPIIDHINTALMVLNQNGVGPTAGLMISDEITTWDDFIGSSPINLAAVKTYVYLSVKLDFDPPENGSLLAAMQARHKELEWRLNVQAETEIKEVGYGAQARYT